MQTKIFLLIVVSIIYLAPITCRVPKNVELNKSANELQKSDGKQYNTENEHDDDDYRDILIENDNDDETNKQRYKTNKQRYKPNRKGGNKKTGNEQDDDDYKDGLIKNYNDDETNKQRYKSNRKGANKKSYAKDKSKPKLSRTNSLKMSKEETNLSDNIDQHLIVEDDGSLCSLKLNFDISKKNEPLFLTKQKSEGNFKLAIPELVGNQPEKTNSGVGVIQFSRKQNIYLACPGKNNVLNIDDSNNDMSEIKCISGTKVSLSINEIDKTVDASKLICKSPAKGMAVFSKDKIPCGSGKDMGVIVELGFSVEGWHKLLEVCFIEKEVRTLYVQHTLHGSVLAGAVIDSNRPKFNKGQDDFYKGYDPDIYYKMANEKEVITEITGSSDYFDDNKNLYLARGHFAPDADFIYKSWQDLTYFFVNCAPQWQSINQGHWLSVERLSRNIAMKLKEDMDVVTGSYGVMKIADKDIYLDIKESSSKKKKNKKPLTIPKLAVPNYYWKLIHRPKTNQCIVMISTNNPYIENPHEFCQNIGSDYSWPVLSKAKQGFVFYCSYKDFKNTVNFAPEFDCSGGILKAP